MGMGRDIFKMLDREEIIEGTEFQKIGKMMFVKVPEKWLILEKRR